MKARAATRKSSTASREKQFRAKPVRTLKRSGKRREKKKTVAPVKKTAKKNLTASYNTFKTFHGQQYTGMAIGRGHKWNYDKGEWKETKVTPDKWEFTFSTVKRRKGKAPEGSGVPVGTEYHWYILSHQLARKLDANSYTIDMSGLKYKLAHKRADHEKWSITERGQKKRLIRVLQELIAQIERELEKPSEKKSSASKKTTAKKPAKKTAAFDIE